MVPLFDPQPQHSRVTSGIHEAVSGVIDSGQFILGRHVSGFEGEVAAYHGGGEAIGVASGTDALHLALLAVGVGPGDEVITSPFSFIAGVEAILYCGAVPVFVDIDPRTLNLDPAALEAAVSPRTRAIMPVHIFGLPADMDPIMAAARRHELRVVEDCAQAFGARYDGKAVGTIGDAGGFSFFPTKNLGGYGDGGLVLSRDPAVADKVRVLRNHGSRERYHHDCVGFNSRLDEVQAAALRIKLPHLDEFNASRRAVADRYSELLGDLALELPPRPERTEHVFGQFTIRVADRDRVRAALAERGIASAIYYPVPLHRQAVCEGVSRQGALPVCEAVAQDCLSLPIFPGMTMDQVDEVATALRTVLAA